jgi:gamma-glutamyl phosphate reductase
MDYVEGLLILSTTIAEMRQRILNLEAKVNHLDGDTPSVEALVERIEELENRDWNDSWEDNVVSIAEAAIENIDWEDRVMAEVRGMSISLSID